MGLKFLILNTDYPDFLSQFYAQNPGLAEQPYQQQLEARNASLFGVADFYSYNLRQLGHEAAEVHANNEPMQERWAVEHALNLPPRRLLDFRLRRGLVPWVSFRNNPKRMFAILEAQIQHYRADVLLNQAMVELPGCLLRAIKGSSRLLVGQIASPLPPDSDLACYELIVSSMPHLVAYFRKLGIPSELNHLAFEPRVLQFLRDGGGEVPFSFIGSVSDRHRGRLELLEFLCKRTAIEVWGPSMDRLPDDSAVHNRYRGTAWGGEMYRTLRNSKMTLNHHIDLADVYANNMRLYEATGVGACLITDWKENLGDILEPGREVLTYRTPAECVELVEYYLAHDEERKAIARAGQQCTLKKHTYAVRMQELVEIISKYLVPFRSRAGQRN